MRNNRGYAIITVLLILGLISILGAGLLTMSRLDINFTGAAKNYDVLFNLADGACSIAYNDIVFNGVSTNKNYQSSEGYIGSSNVLASYNVLETVQVNTTAPPGYELGQGGGYYTEQWTGQGIASKGVGSLMVEVAILKTIREGT